MTYPALHVCSERCITMPFSSLLSLFWRCNVFISFKCQFCYSIFIPTLHVFISCILKMYTWQHRCLCVFLSSWKYHGSASSFFILSYLLVILEAKWVVRLCCCTQICQILLERFYVLSMLKVCCNLPTYFCSGTTAVCLSRIFTQIISLWILNIKMYE
jgi:hypothetical protein